MNKQLKKSLIMLKENELATIKQAKETIVLNAIAEKQKTEFKILFVLKRLTSAFMLTVGICFAFMQLSAQTMSTQLQDSTKTTKLFIDVHQLQPGKVTAEAVADAHAKDLAVQSKYGVQFLKYWVNEDKGLVYCLSSAADSAAIRKTHAEAHGLLPDYIYSVTDGEASIEQNGSDYFLDIHELGAGNVTAEAVAAAHQKDLNVQDKHDVQFINYWVDEKDGVVMCLSKAKNADSVIATHKEAHGLLPSKVIKVKQGD